MKPFSFKKFSVQQSEKVFRIGTDAVLLGSLANISQARSILEIGAGTGIISLMLAQRNVFAKITAIDIDENAVQLAALNFRNSPFFIRLLACHADFNNFETQEKFDLIISNPPYFGENNSTKDKIARQTVKLSFEQLVTNTAKLLKAEGSSSIILPSEFADEFTEICLKKNLYLNRKVKIYARNEGAIKRNVLEFSPYQKTLTFEDFIIEKSPRKFSDQYLELTKDFHVFEE